MTFLTYNNGVPAANDDPSVDQGDMLTNTVSAGVWPTVDHHGYRDNIGGYHKIIRQDTSSPGARSVNRTTGAAPIGFPNAIANINQLFAVQVITPSGTDTQLFSVTGNQAPGQGSQLTGNFASNEGYGWFSGILMQWGTVSPIAGLLTGSVVFANAPRTDCFAFPTGIFTVITNFIGGAGSTNDTLKISAISKTGFTWFRTGTNSTYTGFYWIAIGN